MGLCYDVIKFVVTTHSSFFCFYVPAR